MENKNRSNMQEQWPLYSGIILLVFAGLLALTAAGHGTLLAVVLGTLCFVLVALGFLAGSIFGAGFGLLVWFVIKKAFERFTIPCLILFIIGGAGLIVWHMKKDRTAAPAEESTPGEDDEAGTPEGE